jgi:hypothetical protein
MPTVDHVKNGHRAWTLLRDHYGNETFMNHEIKEAYTAIDTFITRKSMPTLPLKIMSPSQNIITPWNSIEKWYLKKQKLATC